MTITQEMLIREIAHEEDLDIATIRRVFGTLEEIVIKHLSSTTETNDTTVKILNGISIECNYVPERNIHRFKDLTCSSRIWAKPKITRHFNRKLNKEDF